MAVNLSEPEKLLPVRGASMASVSAGIRYKDRDDLVVFYFDSGTSVAAVFTQNKCCAAPVELSKKHLEKENVRALLINSGNANAVTGTKGMQNATRSCELLAQELGIDTHQVLPFSTGVIGEQLNMPAFEAGLKSIKSKLDVDGWLSASKAIMTTDTLPKGASRQFEVNGEVVTITGISKGSGMICPNMATMLAYVVTDAKISQDVLNQLLKQGVEESFNRITVDSDTSTNDSLVLAATGSSGVNLTETGDALEIFYGHLREVLIEIATSIVRDGEGATKFVEIRVSEGKDFADCRTVAYDIAHSPLVKTALFASDPNWGRILMALGKSAVASLDMQKVDIQIGDVSLIEQGQPAATYTEELGKAVFSQPEITIHIQLNTGENQYCVWTSDLSHNYVSINADYRS